jgi:hypothetical protein
MFPVIQRVLDFLTGSSPGERENEEMLDFYQRKLREHPSSATGLPPPINIQVEERQVSVGQFHDDPPLEEQFAPDDPVLSAPPPGITSFISGATVKIAGIPASGVTFISATQISCTTPAHEGYASVEVTNPSGQTSSLDNAIFYTVYPDNFLLVGYQLVDGYQLCGAGHTYPYALTARLGGNPFNPHPAHPFYARLLIVGYGNLCFSTVAGGSCFFPGNPNNPIQFDNFTGHTTTYLGATFAKADDSPGSLGPNGFVDHGAWLSATTFDIGQRVPLLGDATFQPNYYHIVINPSAPPPSGLPPSTDYFVWDDIDRPRGEFAWGWISGSNHTLQIRCIHPDGTPNTGYNGTAILAVQNLTPGGSGHLSVSVPPTIVFSAGIATTGVTANYSTSGGGQSYGYFRINAQDSVNGSIQGATPTATVLNHL